VLKNLRGKRQTAGKRVYEIVLTGGPGGGKTTAVRLLGRLLSRSGIRVLTVPEFATLLIERGTFDIAAISREDSEANCAFQKELFETHRKLRQKALDRTASFDDQQILILYDRGELDGRAWHNHDCFYRLAAAENTTLSDICESYDSVIHLVTAADGAYDAYTMENNEARWESAEEAIARDQKVMAVWREHPRFEVLDNRYDFPDKVDRLLQTILRVMGLPTQLNIDLSNAIRPAAEVTPEFEQHQWGRSTRAKTGEQASRHQSSSG
jgi:predicted ATPase